MDNLGDTRLGRPGYTQGEVVSRGPSGGPGPTGDIYEQGR
jgi:hypothetical protein